MGGYLDVLILSYMEQRLHTLRENYRLSLRNQHHQSILNAFRQTMLAKLSNPQALSTSSTNSKRLSVLSFSELNPHLSSDNPSTQTNLSYILSKRFEEALKQLDDVEALKALIMMIKHPNFNKTSIDKHFA